MLWMWGADGVALGLFPLGVRPPGHLPEHPFQHGHSEVVLQALLEEHLRAMLQKRSRKRSSPSWP